MCVSVRVCVCVFCVCVLRVCVVHRGVGECAAQATNPTNLSMFFSFHEKSCSLWHWAKMELQPHCFHHMVQVELQQYILCSMPSVVHAEESAFSPSENEPPRLSRRGSVRTG